MLENKFHASQEKLEDLIKVYKPYDAASLVNLFMICHDLLVDHRLIDLSEVDSEDLERAKERIYTNFTHHESEFIEQELESRYWEETYNRKSGEFLYA